MTRLPILFLAVFLATSTLADDRLAGRWRLDATRSDDVSRAINETVRKMNVLTRGIARGRLRKTNPPYPTIEISLGNDNVGVLAGPGPRIVMPRSGSTVRWKRADGETFNVTGKLSDVSFVQTFDANDGRRTNVFSVGSDGRLTMSVTVTSPRLPAPLRYKLVYGKG